jgi:para-aminobenzoate synthetase component 1
MFDDPPKNRGLVDPPRDRAPGRWRVGNREQALAAASCTALRLRSFGSERPVPELFEALRGLSHRWLLDSALVTPRLGRFSFFGADPYLVLRCWGHRIELECRRPVAPGLPPGRRVLSGDPFEVLREVMPPPPEARSDAPPFVGGAVGYLGYELAEHLEELDLRGRDDLGLPDLILLYVDRVVAFDHERGGFTLCGLGMGRDARSAEASADSAVECLEAALRRGATRAPSAPSAARDRSIESAPDVDAGTYAKAVDEAKQEIAAGNVYQACLTHRMERRWTRDPWTLYRRLRRINPAPFASYFELPEVALAGSSPERFLQVGSDGWVESRPIKGTRPRGRTPDADAALRADLAASAKDRAENLMIVDLVRNDLGRVCEIGSVSVPELMAIEDYAAVFQMVSTVRGRLRGDRDVVDLVRATFPPGSMTGAPKIAAMRILERLETFRRGVYSGAIGYLDVRGGADLSVAIRTIVVRDGRALVHSGGGIVADSNPADEYAESQDKVAPLLTALGDDGLGARVYP